MHLERWRRGNTPETDLPSVYRKRERRLADLRRSPVEDDKRPLANHGVVTSHPRTSLNLAYHEPEKRKPACRGTADNPDAVSGPPCELPSLRRLGHRCRRTGRPCARACHPAGSFPRNADRLRLGSRGAEAVSELGLRPSGRRQVEQVASPVPPCGFLPVRLLFVVRPVRVAGRLFDWNVYEERSDLQSRTLLRRRRQAEPMARAMGERGRGFDTFDIPYEEQARHRRISDGRRRLGRLGQQVRRPA